MSTKSLQVYYLCLQQAYKFITCVYYRPTSLIPVSTTSLQVYYLCLLQAYKFNTCVYYKPTSLFPVSTTSLQVYYLCLLQAYKFITCVYYKPASAEYLFTQMSIPQGKYIYKVCYQNFLKFSYNIYIKHLLYY